MPREKPKKTGYEKVRYEIDPYNRLIISSTGKKAGPPEFREVLTGRFKTDKNNSLSYLIKAPVPHKLGIPHQVKLQGKWSLTAGHNLQLTLNKQARQTLGDKLTLQGTILDVRKNSLLFAVTTKTKEDVQTTYILKLAGRWQADKHNRLTFKVRRERGRYDILTFQGAWKINKQHQIIYKYKKTQLIRKQKQIHTLTFKGYWDIKDKTRISYVLDKATDSSFNFKTSLGIFKADYIRYKVGIGVEERRKPIKRIITLFGTWKIKKGIGLFFEVEYENKKLHAIVFGAKAKLTAKDKISFRLRNELNKDIGAELQLSHKILKGDGQAFLRMLKSKQESAVLVGAGFRW